MDIENFIKKNKCKEILRFKYSDSKRILKEQLNIKTPLSSLYRVAVLGVTLFGGAFLGFYIAGGFIEKALLSILFTIIGIIIMMFLHEGIHWLAYKIVGAKEIKIHIDFKNRNLYTTADKFIMDKKSFYFVELSPLIIIFSIIYLGIKLFPDYSVTFSLLMIWHFFSCNKDIKIVNYFYSYKGQKIFKYDDLSNKECVILKGKASK